MIKMNKGKTYRLEDMETQFVSLVRAGANRQTKFMVVKRDTEKAVPAADATDEAKRAAQTARAQQHGIEALDSGANLSYPGGNPTTEAMYGDPANLKYPLGRENNEPDAARIRNALARFVQNADTYSEQTSQAKIWERIVRAAMAAGIEHAFDFENKLDALLPQGLKDELTKDVTLPGASPEDASDTNKEAADAKDAEFLAMLEAAGATVDGLLIDTQIDTAMDQFVSAPPEAPESGSTITRVKSGTRSDAHSDNDPSKELRKQLEAEREEHARAQAELRKTRDKLRKNEASVKRLRSTIGKSSALSFGEIDVIEPTNEGGGGGLWSGDLADEANQDE